MPNAKSPRVTRFAFFRDLSMSMINLVYGRFFRKLHVPTISLASKSAIVTGANSGIGFQIALELAKRGATVYLACRNKSKAEAAVANIESQVPSSHGRVKGLSLDTSSLASVRAFAEHWRSRDPTDRRIDFLFHNAGISSAPSDGNFTIEGFPLLYATNFLGSYLLTYLLETYLARDARIILTSSTGQYGGSISSTFSLQKTTDKLEAGFHVPAAAVKNGKIASESSAYGNTKSMQVAFAKLLQEQLDSRALAAGKHDRRIVHSFTPGYTKTAIFEKTIGKSFRQDLLYRVLKGATALATDVSQGAATGLWLATTQDEAVIGEGNGGGYWDRMKRRISKADVMSPETLERLGIRWEADAGVEWR